MRILLVDDAAADIELIGEWLERGGAQITRAYSDVGAYQALGDDAHFDALVTDLNLGFGTTGFDVARAARARWPDITIVYLSGQRPASDLHAVAGSLFVPKGRPSTTAIAVLQALREKLGQLNDEPGSGSGAQA